MATDGFAVRLPASGSRYNRGSLHKILTLTLITAALATGAACNRSTPGSGSTPATQAADKPAGTAPAAAPTPPPKPVPQALPDVLARVNDEPVKKTDFDLLLRNIELNNGPIPAERRDEILRKVLDDLVTYTMLKQEAKARNIEVADAEIEQQLAVMKQEAGTEERFKKALADRNMTVERLKSDARVQLSISKMMNAQVASAAAATDADVKAFYDKNPDKFKRGESVRASHILIRVSEKAPEEDKQKARARIDAVLKRAKAGEDFAVLAREHSQDGSAAQGGDLNYFEKGRMVAPFDKVAFTLKPNEISDVVTTEFGYHIIKVVDHKAAGTVPMEEVAENVKKFLTEQKKQETAQGFISQVKQKAKIEVLI
jgi:peptidyl-prolyl cis-trans isomerase C